MMTNEIFLHFSRCAKAGFLFANNLNLIDLNYQGQKFLAKEFHEVAFKIIKKYKKSADIEIIRNKEVKTSGGETAIADIIVKSGNSNSLIALINSTTEPDWLQIQNLAYTFYVFGQAQIKFDSAFICFVSKEYVNGSELTYELLRIKDYTKKVKNLQSRVQSVINKSKEKIRNNVLPDNKMEYCCIKPSICPFKKSCEKNAFPEESSILELKDISFYRKLQLYRAGITSYKIGLPMDFVLSGKNDKQVEYTLTNKIIFDKKEIKHWLNKQMAKKFVWFLDMETDTPVMPISNSKRPFAKYPFIYTLQYSDLATKSKGSFQKIMPTALTALVLKDFIENFITQVNLNLFAPIVVGNINKVKEALRNASIVLPNSEKEINEVIKRLVDIKVLFTDQLYYNPKFKGSTYLKDIIPIICPEISYSELSIKSGLQAQYEYRKLISEKADVKEKVITELKAYSFMDVKSLSSTFQFLLKESGLNM
ncbi:MAG: DUF2779 domain-containing protein [Bacteroidota bacterium]|nr:DUF2779 domain-containing protein [Bacteroidota bacterium]